MDGDDNERPLEGGVRRRHSSHHEDEDIGRQEQGQGHSTIPGISGSLAATGSSSQAIMSPSGAIHNGGRSLSLASDHTPRAVRFSTDVERDMSSGSRGGLGQAQLDGSSDSHGQNQGMCHSPPTLPTNTMAAQHAPGHSIPSQGTVQPPSGISPSSPRPSLRTSPISLQSRNRGYSLRSALFQRNIREQAESSGSIIELQEAGPSSHVPFGQASTEQTSSKKSGDTTVTVAPVYDGKFYDLPTNPPKGVRGVAALPHYETWIRERAHKTRFIRSVSETYRQLRKVVLRISEIPPSQNGRHIDLDASRKTSLMDERTGKSYVSNTIRSSRYTAWNFLPRQLFAQFSKLANFYFLCVSILQMIPGLSTTGTYTTIAPLLFFVSLSMAKEGYDDLRRYRLDKAENNRDAAVLHAYRPVSGGKSKEDTSSPSTGPIHWATTKWKDLQVGDIVRLNRDEAAPADLVFLHSDGANNIAYIETMALDGETNLKSKQTASSLSRSCQGPDGVAGCKAHFVVEDPNLDLYNFEGKVTVGTDTAPLTNAEIVYRGSVLRNTPRAVGMVIYTGEECKIRMNANKNPRIKAPALQAVVNRIVVVIVTFVVVLAVFNTVAYKIWARHKEHKAWYLARAGVAFGPVFMSFIIMLNTMIPLSLYVSLEIIKLAQMFLLNDIDMYDEVSDTPFEARTSTINEELGQISYIFSDKTGTLTDNSMKFRKMSVAGTAWIHDADLHEDASNGRRLIHKKRNKGKKAAGKSRASESFHFRKSGLEGLNDDAMHHYAEASGSSDPASKWKSSARPAKSQPELNTRHMIRYMQRKPFTMFARKARLFLLSIALCHTCLPEVQENGDIDFQASSPDELALVRAAQELGYLIVNRDAGTLTLRHYPLGMNKDFTEEVYEILDVVEFSSKRKRMSVVVRFPDQRICVFCKGADSIVMQRLRLATLANQKVVEIEYRASKRKSLEAQYAMRRKSEQIDGRNSIARPSLGRVSLGGLGCPSMSGSKLQPIRDEVDGWLRDRERDVDVSSIEDNNPYYSPRPSAQIGRHSLALSEARSSMQLDDEEDLVEESLVVDEVAVIERCFQHINDFATEGLRTLLYGYRFLDEQEYLAWKKIYLDATTSLVRRQEMIEKAGELIEQDLELAGATAIEDKLQKGVPEAIDKLRRANIKMWMLTGDKRETAVNIGHSCRLIKDYSSVTVLDHETGEVEQHIASAILAINEGNVAHSVVVVDGQTLSIIEADKSIRTLFFDLAILADSVVCCRASPSQKAGLVKAIRKTVNHAITLAIGDGANDIAMIQEAHVGIGITGKEGLQAARTSDYSIAQFRFLTKLLLVHGRWNYIRTCKYTVGTFWKEMFFYLGQALYQRWVGYTGTSLYESWSLSMFNTASLFTSLPVIFMGVFEKDLAASTLLAVPELYVKGQRNGGFNAKVYVGWMLMAASETMIVFFCMLGLYGQAELIRDNGIYALGNLVFTACVIMISTKMQLIEMHNKSIVVVISFIASVGGWFLWNMVLATVYHNNVLYNVKGGLFHRFGHTTLWWLTLILAVASCVVFELGIASLRTAFWPTDVDTFQELERDLLIRKRFEEAAAMELQQGWDRGEKRSSLEIERLEAEQEAREGEVRNILRNRPDTLEGGKANAVASPGEKFPPQRRAAEIQETLSRRFGTTRGASVS